MQSIKQKLEEATIELQGREAEIESWKKMYKDEAKKNEILAKDNDELKKTIAEQNAEISKHNDELTIANATILDLQEELSKSKGLKGYSTTELLQEIVKRVFNFSK